MQQKRRNDVEFYKLFAKDDSFNRSLFNLMKQMADDPEVVDEQDATLKGDGDE